MVEAMVLGGLRRCEVLGLRLGDLRPGERRVFIAEGKGGHQRIVPVSPPVLRGPGRLPGAERPRTSWTDRVFVVLKGPRRGQPLARPGWTRSPGARRRAVSARDLSSAAAHLPDPAAGGRDGTRGDPGPGRPPSIESTRIYVHLANDWLAGNTGGRPRRSTPRPSRCHDGDGAQARTRCGGRRGLPRRDGRRGPTDRTVDDPGRAQLPGQDPPGRRLGSSEPRRAARRGGEGAVVRVVADGHRSDHRGCRADPGATDLRLGNAARLYCANDHRWFREICSRLEISGADTTVQWNTLAKITAITGASTPSGHRRTFRRRSHRDDDRLRSARQAQRWPDDGGDLPPAATDLVSRRQDHNAAPARSRTAGRRDRMGNGHTGIHFHRAPLPRAGHGEPATQHGQTHRTRPTPIRLLARGLPIRTWAAAPTCTASTSKRSRPGCRPTPPRVPANHSTGSASRTR